MTEKTDNLIMEPVNAESKLGTLCQSIKIGLRILRNFDKNYPTVISVFQPFQLGLIGYILSRLTGTPLNLELRNDYFSTPYSGHTFWSRKKWSDKLSTKMYYLLARWLLRRAESIIPVSGGRMRDSLIAFGVKPERIHPLRCLLYTSPSPRDRTRSRMPSSA